MIPTPWKIIVPVHFYVYIFIDPIITLCITFGNVMVMMECIHISPRSFNVASISILRASNC